MRRWNGNSFGQKFLGNSETQVVHDLDNEKPDCWIDQIIAAGRDEPYVQLFDANGDGYALCPHCIGAWEW